MKTLIELQEAFGEGETSPTGELLNPYFFYCNSPAPENFIQWASENIPLHHFATVIDGDMYIATTETFTTPDLPQITV